MVEALSVTVNPATGAFFSQTKTVVVTSLEVPSAAFTLSTTLYTQA
ncbi:MAG: hypothetical protein WCJ39_06525 [bacterium]